MPTDRQQWWRVKRQFHPQGNKAARASDQLRSSIHHCRNRIVAALQYLPVVHQKRIRNRAQPRQCFVIIDCNRLLAQVGAGHHQSPQPPIRKQQMLQRRIGQKHAQPGNPRRNALRDSAAVSLPRQHNRARHCLQQRLFRRSQRAHLARRLHVLHHHGQRLPITVLALSQPHHRCLIGGVNAQVKAADPFDGHDLAGHKAVNRRGHGIVC